MKKALVFVVVIALVMSLALSVSAVLENPAKVDNDPIPVMVSCTCDKYAAYTTEEAGKLPQDAQEIFMEAEKKLPEAVPEDMAVRYFFYAEICDACEAVSTTYEMADQKALLILQFVDGKWIERKFTVDGGKTVTVEEMTEGPVAFVVRVVDKDSIAAGGAASVGSATAAKKDLMPFVAYSSCSHFCIVTAEDADVLAEQAQTSFAEAKKTLPDAVPQGMLVRYFFYIDICEVCENSMVVFQLNELNVAAVKQFVDGAWVELEIAVNENGTITVFSAVDAPMAILVK